MQSAACLNCRAPLTGPFCAACGQRDVPAYPSVRELAIDAVHELSGWDGRLAATVRALLARPGMLTREFLEGRRARYIAPLRLYLTASLVYFVLAAASPNVTLASGKTLFLGLRVTPTIEGKSPESRPERLARTAQEAVDAQQALTAEAKAEALAEIKRAPALIQPFLRRAIEDPAGFRRSLLEALPRMLFALLPVFAAIVALLYRGRKYPEHLYFAMHLNAFIFLALAAKELLKFTQLLPLVIVGSIGALVSIPVYATLAFRRVYGGSLVRTLSKAVAIGALYTATFFAVFVTVVYWVAIAG